MRPTIAVGLLVVLAAAAVPLFGAPVARGGTVSIHLYGSLTSGWGFGPSNESNPGPTIYVKQGDTINLLLNATDGSPITHTFYVDYNGNNATDSDEHNSPVFTPAGGTSWSFIENRSGTFFYKCGVHQWSMRGVWVANATGVDTAPPVVSNVAAAPSPQASGGAVNITATATDNVAVTNVSVHIVGPSSFDRNVTMTRANATRFYLNQTYATNGTYTVTVWARDAAGNFGSGTGTFTIGSGTGGTPATPTNYTAAIAAAVVVIVLFLIIGAWMMRRKPKKEEPPPEE